MIRFAGSKAALIKPCKAFASLVAAGIHPQVIMSIHAGNIDDIEALVVLSRKSRGRIGQIQSYPTNRSRRVDERTQPDADDSAIG